MEGWKNPAKEGSGFDGTRDGIREGYERGGRWVVGDGRGQAVGRNQQGSWEFTWRVTLELGER